ncbi:hypothetical protein GOV14_02600 [Candidatus Pacearchaeota archaeon]|nr:hypothetical protein [Candidatus Pacearchaeota archaeon]
MEWKNIKWKQPTIIISTYIGLLVLAVLLIPGSFLLLANKWVTGILIIITGVGTFFILRLLKLNKKELIILTESISIAIAIIVIGIFYRGRNALAKLGYENFAQPINNIGTKVNQLYFITPKSIAISVFFLLFFYNLTPIAYWFLKKELKKDKNPLSIKK